MPPTRLQTGVSLVPQGVEPEALPSQYEDQSQAHFLSLVPEFEHPGVAPVVRQAKDPRTAQAGLALTLIMQWAAPHLLAGPGQVPAAEHTWQNPDPEAAFISSSASRRTSPRVVAPNPRNMTKTPTCHNNLLISNLL